ncbi:MAG: chemotaxis protein CheA [Dehalococcoidales bacterium]|nr:chemotaxis protein CheA [Dehalococcoidales bacterium]
MSPTFNATPEELEVFMQEADEQLQLLDEDLVNLEREGMNPGLIQEIFRAAHTLKGSSAMLGYERMSQVAHTMETLLDNIRNGAQVINSTIIDTLLHGLDALKELRCELLSQDNQVNVQNVISELNNHLGKDSPPAPANNNKISINKKMDELISKLRRDGNNIYHMKIELDRNSTWNAVRFFQILDELRTRSVVVNSLPTMEDIETGKVDYTLELIIGTQAENAAIVTAVKNIEDVTSVNIELYQDGMVAVKEIETPVKPPEPEHKDAGKNNSAAVKKDGNFTQTIRVDVRVLDTLMNMVGEMVIDRNRIRQLARQLELKYEDDEDVKNLSQTSNHIMKLVNELQEQVLRARMLKIGTILNSFPRLVRDLAHTANKRIDFIVEGQETELDRSIIEQVKDPLIHLLRNSVDHGIEPPVERLDAGKAEAGVIKLAAYQEQNHIVIKISDDGRGIHPDKIRKAAIKKQIISEEDARRMPDEEVYNLIFVSGLSTAEKVTEVSGRGVGMDVVKTNIEGLGGAVNLRSEPGKGTEFTIRLPLTLATTYGLLATSSRVTYVIPIATTVEIFKPRDGDIQTVVGREVIRFRQNVLPLVRLNREFGNQVQNDNPPGEFIVVIKVGEKQAGLLVDSVAEPIESVVKSLGKYVGSVRGVAGATILGDGQVALILDAATLVANANLMKYSTN